LRKLFWFDVVENHGYILAKLRCNASGIASNIIANKKYFKQ
jgi:hypothetical protein